MAISTSPAVEFRNVTPVSAILLSSTGSNNVGAIGVFVELFRTQNRAIILCASIRCGRQYDPADPLRRVREYVGAPGADKLNQRLDPYA